MAAAAHLSVHKSCIRQSQITRQGRCFPNHAPEKAPSQNTHPWQPSRPRQGRCFPNHASGKVLPRSRIHGSRARKPCLPHDSPFHDVAPFHPWQIDWQLTKVDPRRRHGKRLLPAAEVEEEDEEEALPPSPPPAKHEQLEEPHHVVLQLQGATFSGGGGSSSSSVVGAAADPSLQAYAQYYYSARADNDASIVASALTHIIRASPDHLPPQPQHAAALYGAGALRQGQGQGQGDHPQAAAHHYPGGHHAVAAAEEEQGTRTAHLA